jgi:hypothetical protein
MVFLSVKVMLFRFSANFHPEVLYSTERQSFWNFGNPFLPGIPCLQFSKKRLIDDHARSALACLATLLSSFANGKFFANTVQYLFKSYLLTLLLSIQNRIQLLRMNRAVRIASSTALNWFDFPYVLNSKTSMNSTFSRHAYANTNSLKCVENLSVSISERLALPRRRYPSPPCRRTGYSAKKR